MSGLERTSSNDSTTKTIDEIRIRNCGSEHEIVVKKRCRSISRSFLPQAHLQARRANAHLHVQRKPVSDLGRVGFLKHHKNRLEHVLIRNPDHPVELFTLPPAKVRPLAVLSVLRYAYAQKHRASCGLVLRHLAISSSSIMSSSLMPWSDFKCIVWRSSTA